MIYAIRHQGKRWTLVELKSMKALEALEALDDGRDYTPVTAWWARDWVRGGGDHDTALSTEATNPTPDKGEDQQ